MKCVIQLGVWRNGAFKDTWVHIYMKQLPHFECKYVEPYLPAHTPLLNAQWAHVSNPSRISLLV